jgi:hypothetical protein
VCLFFVLKYVTCEEPDLNKTAVPHVYRLYDSVSRLEVLPAWTNECCRNVSHVMWARPSDRIKGKHQVRTECDEGQAMRIYWKPQGFKRQALHWRETRSMRIISYTSAALYARYLTMDVSSFLALIRLIADPHQRVLLNYLQCLLLPFIDIVWAAVVTAFKYNFWHCYCCLPFRWNVGGIL